MLDELGEALECCGFHLRGGFVPAPGDDVPPALDGRPARAVVLVGSVGPRMWRHFRAERPDGENPLDTWCESRLGRIAADVGARAVFPFERPFLPFQRWVRRAEPCHVSPLRILIHPEYGLWHAIRGALLFAAPLDLPGKAAGASPCRDCAGRPCLSACPVGAFSPKGLDAERCAAHLESPEGAECMALGCLARRACPVGQDYRHGGEQAAFHMTALRAWHRERGSQAGG